MDRPQVLATIPGVGSVTAPKLAIEIDPAAFGSGRHLAARATGHAREGGLTPKEHSARGKPRLGGTGRAGTERLRVLLATGATSVIKAAMKAGCRQMTDWLRAVPNRPASVGLPGRAPDDDEHPGTNTNSMQAVARLT
jgi:transposase